jgi:hypothetical protein
VIDKREFENQSVVFWDLKRKDAVV